MLASQDLIREIRAPPVEDTAFSMRRSAFRRTVGLDDAIDTMRPSAKTRAMAESSGKSSTSVQFLNTGDRVNIPKQLRSSLPAVGAGVKGYIDFFRFLRVNSFRPKSIYIDRRSALFPDGPAFGMYVKHVERACSLLGLRAGWRTPAGECVMMGLDNATVSRVKFTNVRSFSDLSRFLHRESLRSEFGTICFLAFSLLFRLRSGPPPRIRLATPIGI